MALSIERLRATIVLPRREVEVPDLDGTVWVRALTLKEVREIQEFQANKRNQAVDVTRRMVEVATVNEDGSPLFVGEDKALVGDLSWGTIRSISEAVSDLSGLNKDASDDAEKN